MDITKVLAVITTWLKVVGILFLGCTIIGSFGAVMVLLGSDYGKAAVSFIILLCSASLLFSIMLETGNL